MGSSNDSRAPHEDGPATRPCQSRSEVVLGLLRATEGGGGGGGSPSIYCSWISARTKHGQCGAGELTLRRYGIWVYPLVIRAFINRKQPLRFV